MITLSIMVVYSSFCSIFCIFAVQLEEIFPQSVFKTMQYRTVLSFLKDLTHELESVITTMWKIFSGNRKHLKGDKYVF